MDRYTGNIVIPKIVKPGFHCSLGQPKLQFSSAHVKLDV